MKNAFKPRLFIGSSSEAQELARKLHTHLEDVAEPTIWSQGIFHLNDNTLESLIKATDNFDFAVFIFSKDDVLRLRNNEYQAARDNVILEFGLFIGSIGRDRTYYLIPKDSSDFRIPTDLAGITPATYDERIDGNLMASLNSAADQIRQRIKALNLKSRGYAKELEMLFEKNGDTKRELNMPIVARLKNQEYTEAEALCRNYLKQYPNSIRARYNLIVTLVRQSEKMKIPNEKMNEATLIFMETVNEDLLLFLKLKEAINDPIKYVLTDPDLQSLFNVRPGLKDIVHSYKKFLEPDMGVKKYGSGGCFTSDMTVLLWNKSYKPISEIAKGDKVVSFDNKGLPCESVVKEKFKTISIPIVINDTIKITPSQPVLTNNEEWVLARDLKIGDSLKSDSNKCIIINRIELSAEAHEVYSLELTPHHNYLVQGIVAHNKMIIGDNF